MRHRPRYRSVSSPFWFKPSPSPAWNHQGSVAAVAEACNCSLVVNSMPTRFTKTGRTRSRSRSRNAPTDPAVPQQELDRSAPSDPAAAVAANMEQRIQTGMLEESMCEVKGNLQRIQLLTQELVPLLEQVGPHLALLATYVHVPPLRRLAPQHAQNNATEATDGEEVSTTATEGSPTAVAVAGPEPSAVQPDTEPVACE